MTGHTRQKYSTIETRTISLLHTFQTSSRKRFKCKCKEGECKWTINTEEPMCEGKQSKLQLGFHNQSMKKLVDNPIQVQVDEHVVLSQRK